MKSLARNLAPILVILAGAGVAAFFYLTRPQAPRASAKPLPPRVEVTEVAPERRAAEVNGLGTLVPAQRVALQPEVSGAVRFVAPGLVPGGIVKKGEVLVRIDPRNYRIAVQQQEANVTRSQYELQLERGRQRVAKREWDLLRDSTEGEADEALALRKPQLANAEAGLGASRSALERARIDLSRTSVRAPFNAFVQEKSVALGQVVQPNTPVATLVGTNVFWAQVSLPMADLALIRVPDGKGQEGSRARVFQSLGGDRTVEREGKVIRVLGDLGQKGKMARVLVEVRDPLNLGGESEVPFLLGSVVRVRIEGNALDDVYVLPRLALHEGAKVWLVEEGKLAIRTVDVAFRGRDEVYVRGALGNAARVITSRLPAPVPGMAVRLEGGAPTAEAR